jgi:uncharacterized protein
MGIENQSSAPNPQSFDFMKKKLSRTQPSRYANQRFNADPSVINAIFDEALLCHVSFTLDNQPFILPTGFCRVDKTLYLHGSVGSHFFMQMAKGIPVCIGVTHIDALILARCVFNHSVNYRSVVAFGTTRLVTDEAEKWLAAEKFTEHMIPGRWNDARQPTPKEMQKTMFIAVEIEEMSCKMRTHGVGDDEEDMDLPVWAGLIPLKLTPQYAEQDDVQDKAVMMPDYVSKYKRQINHRWH